MIEIDLPAIKEVLQMGRGIHLISSLFGSVFLILVWSHIRKYKEHTSMDWGLILIASGLLMWVFMDSIKILQEYGEGENKMLMKIFSSFNNAFFIASLPFFKYGFDKLKKFEFFSNGVTWSLSVLIINSLVILVSYSSLWDYLPDMVSNIDVIYSAITLSLLGYAITSSFKGRQQYGLIFVSISIFITLCLAFTQFIFFPLFKFTSIHIPALLLYGSHTALISLLLVLAQSWVVEEKELEYEREVQEQKLEIDSLQVELKSLEDYHSVNAGNNKPVNNENGVYLRFYKEESLVVVELTILSMGIIGAKIYSKVNREYKDLLRYAVYNKKGIEVKAIGGAHRAFGEVSKANLDIRKKLINKGLNKLGLPEIGLQDLIIQKVRGSGVYELNCHPKYTIIDTDGLKNLDGLDEIIKILDDKII